MAATVTRRRWIAVAATAVFCVGASAVLTASAADSGSVFVPISPVRVLDTRIGAGLDTALTSDVAAKLRVTGAIEVVLPGEVIGTESAVPLTATGIVANVTAVSPTTIGFVSIRPGTAVGLPTTSTINFLTPGDIVPNSASVELPTAGAAAGTLDVWFHGTTPDASTHLLIDIVGYYAPGSGTAGPPGVDGTDGTDGQDGASGPVGPPGPANRISDEQIALLEWYDDPGQPGVVPVGSVPIDVAFDGTYIWVSSNLSGNVTKIDPTTNEVIDTIPLGSSGWNVVFDGSYIWVTLPSVDQIAKVDPATGEVLTTVAVGNGPYSAAFDGQSLWVGNYADGTVTKIDPLTDAVLVPALAVGQTPQAVAFDGEHVWVANADDNTLSKIDPATDSVVDTVAVGFRPAALAFDGLHLWVAHWSAANVATFDPATGAQVGPVIPVGSGPQSLAYDGTNMWVANFTSSTVTKIDATTNSVVATLTADDGIGVQASAVAFDGTNIWVVNYNGGGPGTVTKFVPF